MVLLPFYATAYEYTNEQTRVYHDQSECPEARKIQLRHRIEGTGGRPYCKGRDRIERRFAP